ncbi:MAG: hypothetical protein ACRDA7_00605 [Metamycoplasmataceae bacterium]
MEKRYSLIWWGKEKTPCFIWGGWDYLDKINNEEFILDDYIYTKYEIVDLFKKELDFSKTWIPKELESFYIEIYGADKLYKNKENSDDDIINGSNYWNNKLSLIK